jgi:hypothetical protein
MCCEFVGSTTIAPIARFADSATACGDELQFRPPSST